MMIRVLLALLLPSVAIGAEYYVATNGSSANSGSIGSPWNLEYAGTNGHIVDPGDTIWLRGGTYNTAVEYSWFVYLVTHFGTSNSPIIFRNYPGERAIINPGLYMTTGDHVWFWGLEFTCSTERTNTYQNRPAGLIIAGQSKAINCIGYNTGHAGIGGQGSEVYGCIYWGGGIYEYDNITYWPTNPFLRGSCFYMQNLTNSIVLMADNITRGWPSSAMKAYTEGGYVQNFVFDGNVGIKNSGEGIEIEALTNPVTNGTVINNFLYHNLKTPMGYFDEDLFAQHYSLFFSNNYIIESPGPGVAALWLKRWKNPTVVSNTIITVCRSNEWVAGSGQNPGGVGGKFFQIEQSTNVPLTVTINRNRYFGAVEQGTAWNDVGDLFFRKYQPFYYNEVQHAPSDGTNGAIGFTYWTNSHGFDIESTYTTNMPTDSLVVVRTNKYERGRANIIVVNWQTNSTATVDLSDVGLTNNQVFEIRDAQNFLGSPVVNLRRFDSGSPSVVIPLTGTNVSEVTGNVAQNYTFNPNIHTESLFNVFVVLPSFSEIVEGRRGKPIKLRK